jgi:PAS domain S-box-containing protein
MRLHRSTVGIGLLVVLMALALNAGVIGISLHTIVQSYEKVGHTRQIMLELERTLSLLKDAETGQRGYLLTHDNGYLAPYRAATAELDDALARLRVRAVLDLGQQARITELDRLAREKMAELRHTVALGQQGRWDAALAAVRSDRGKRLMDQMRAVTSAVEAEEQRLLEQRIALAQAAVRRAFLAFAVTAGVALVLLLAVSLLHRRQLLDRERAAEALRREHAWLATTLTSIGDAVIATDAEGRVRFLNPVAEAVIGWPQAEAIGQPLDQVFHIINEYTRQPTENPVVRVIREGIVLGLANHTVLIARDGTEVPIDDSAAPIQDEHGQLLGVVMVFRDVSERRRQQEALRQSEDHLHLALDSATMGTWDYNPRAGALVLGARCRGLFGLPPEADVRYETFLEWLHPDDRARIDRAIQQALEPGGGGALNAEFRAIRLRDGAQRWLAIRGRSYFDEAGRATRLIGTVLDITEPKRVQEELKAAKEAAEVANRAKDQFLAVLSHELRTPLNPVLLAVTAMLDKLPDPDEVRSHLETVRQNVMLQARLIDDLLDVMGIVRGKMPLHWEIADGHALIHQAIAICHSEIHGRGLNLVLDLTAARHHVHADPARLRQVFWNLIKNAIKFTPPGGTVTVRTRNQPESEQPAQDGTLIVEVADTGIGIEPEVLPHIFDPFRQAETTIRRRLGGLGLGLAISRGIVEAHGGRITAESPGPDLGATFRLELRALPAPSAVVGDHPPGTGTPAPAHRAAALRILLVEDEPTTLRLLVRLLEGLGHKVTAADTVASAMTAIASEPFDLLVSDLGLPDGSGLDLVRDMVAQRGPVPAIALTGYGMEEDIQRSQAAGFTVHLTKPIDLTRLQALIEQIATSRACHPSREPTA